MIGLDTNVLVRYLVQDDPTQTRQANALIDRAAAQETAMFINHVVMCELAWVLGRGYGYAKAALIDGIKRYNRALGEKKCFASLVWPLPPSR